MKSPKIIHRETTYTVRIGPLVAWDLRRLCSHAVLQNLKTTPEGLTITWAQGTPRERFAVLRCLRRSEYREYIGYDWVYYWDGDIYREQSSTWKHGLPR